MQPIIVSNGTCSVRAGTTRSNDGSNVTNSGVYHYASWSWNRMLKQDLGNQVHRRSSKRCWQHDLESEGATSATLPASLAHCMGPSQVNRRSFRSFPKARSPSAASSSVHSYQVHPSSRSNMVHKAAVRSTPRHTSGAALSGRARPQACMLATSRAGHHPVTWHTKECPAASWAHSGRAARSCCSPRQRPDIGLCTEGPLDNGMWYSQRAWRCRCPALTAEQAFGALDREVVRGWYGPGLCWRNRRSVQRVWYCGLCGREAVCLNGRAVDVGQGAEDWAGSGHAICCVPRHLPALQQAWPVRLLLCVPPAFVQRH
jgi:hypothetical protein